jgi:hypothetical protein
LLRRLGDDLSEIHLSSLPLTWSIVYQETQDSVNSFEPGCLWARGGVLSRSAPIAADGV